MATFQIPLDIPDVEIIKVETNKADDFIITVESTKKSTKCRKCKKSICKKHGYGEALLLRHLPILDRRVYIRIKPPRYLCEICDDRPTTTEQPDWYTRKSKHTKAYDEHLMRSLINSTVIDVSMKEGISKDSVEGVLNRLVSKKVNWKAYKKLRLLGLDEIALKKGHKDFVVIVSTRIGDKVQVLSILPDRKKKTVKAFIESIPKRLRTTVRTVCSDMYDGYINAAKEVLGSQINVVIDRFHVAKKYRESVDSLRKSELKRLKQELNEEEYKKLKGAMWALRKQSEKLTDEEQLVLCHLFHYSPILKLAYDFSMELTDIFNTNYNKREASSRIKKWIEQVEEIELKCFEKFITTLNNHWDEILNYFHRKGRKNSGFVEGLNNKIKIIKRRCYGIFKIDSLFQRVFLDLQGYQVFSC